MNYNALWNPLSPNIIFGTDEWKLSGTSSLWLMMDHFLSRKKQWSEHRPSVYLERAPNYFRWLEQLKSRQLKKTFRQLTESSGLHCSEQMSHPTIQTGEANCSNWGPWAQACSNSMHIDILWNGLLKLGIVIHVLSALIASLDSEIFKTHQSTADRSIVTEFTMIAWSLPKKQFALSGVLPSFVPLWTKENALNNGQSYFCETMDSKKKLLLSTLWIFLELEKNQLCSFQNYQVEPNLKEYFSCLNGRTQQPPPHSSVCEQILWICVLITRIIMSVVLFLNLLQTPFSVSLL